MNGISLAADGQLWRYDLTKQAGTAARRSRETMASRRKKLGDWRAVTYGASSTIGMRLDVAALILEKYLSRTALIKRQSAMGECDCSMFLGGSKTA
ncbi:hypothetical protein QFC20_007614 [Naganishia adeliensis]|uniref:Uncharacterized protein n=1 Tax=Naganishia adeliensis TaxID=92952 RepID=A0ACC2UXW0_9TREE|nr:hypothetical protein QFC20_007614 [Naganishia adeliensis]